MCIFPMCIFPWKHPKLVSGEELNTIIFYKKGKREVFQKFISKTQNIFSIQVYSRFYKMFIK